MLLIRASIAAIAATVTSSASFAQPESPMSFRADTILAGRLYTQTSGTGIWIDASGVIDEGTTQRLLEFLRTNRIIEAEIVFDSPGGSRPRA